MQPTNDTRAINPNPSTTSNPSHPFILESLSKEVVSSGTYASLNSAQDVSESRDNVEELKGHVHAKVINKGSIDLLVALYKVCVVVYVSIASFMI